MKPWWLGQVGARWGTNKGNTMKDLAAKIAKRVRDDPMWASISRLILKNTTGPVCLVGGKVYRSAVEIIHNYDTGVPYADWDFLCLGDVTKPGQAWGEHMGWYAEENEYENVKANSLCLENGRAKIDIIGIKDIDDGSGDGIHAYFDVVPLTIQAVAIDNLFARAGTSYTPTLFYTDRAERSIRSKTIEINNTKGALPNLDIEKYVRTKAASLKFTHGNVKVSCDCFQNNAAIYSMWNYGCQSPLTHR